MTKQEQATFDRAFNQGYILSKNAAKQADAKKLVEFTKKAKFKGANIDGLKAGIDRHLKEKTVERFKAKIPKVESKKVKGKLGPSR